MKDPIQVKRLGSSSSGYRVLASWKKPRAAFPTKCLDAWIPALAPSRNLWEIYRSERISWEEFCARYLKELHSPSSQDLVKPLALMSFRRAVVLLCDCSNERHCPTSILAQAMEECRRSGNFVLSFEYGNKPLKVAVGNRRSASANL